MPGYKGHLAGGVCVFALCLFFVSSKITIVRAAEWLCFTLLGSLFPDIDTKSKGQKLFYRCIVVCALLFVLQQQWTALCILGVIALFPQLCNHRGVFHEPWFLIAVPLSSFLYIKCCWPHYTNVVMWDALFFAVGAFSHILLDRGIKGVLRF